MYFAQWDKKHLFFPLKYINGHLDWVAHWRVFKRPVLAELKIPLCPKKNKTMNSLEGVA